MHNALRRHACNEHWRAERQETRTIEMLMQIAIVRHQETLIKHENIMKQTNCLRAMKQSRIRSCKLRNSAMKFERLHTVIHCLLEMQALYNGAMIFAAQSTWSCRDQSRGTSWFFSSTAHWFEAATGWCAFVLCEMRYNASETAVMFWIPRLKSGESEIKILLQLLGFHLQMWHSDKSAHQ